MSLENKSQEEIEALANLADSLGSNPKSRMDFLALTKRVHPDANVPEIDTLQRVGALMKPHLEKMDALQRRVDESDLKDRVRNQRREALTVDGVKAGDIPAIEKLMTDKGIPSHKAAAEFLMLQNKVAEPTTASLPGARTFVVPKQPDLKAFGGNLSQWARSEANAAIDELRGRRAA